VGLRGIAFAARIESQSAVSRKVVATVSEAQIARTAVARVWIFRHR